jgi:hypothetical protein
LATEACVGIVFLVGGTLYVESTPLDRAGVYGDWRIHEDGRPDFWDTLGLPGEYDEVPRARVQHNAQTGQWTLLADRCILKRREVVAEIRQRMHLPTSTLEDIDEHYQCPVVSQTAEEGW